ncbi:MAG: hypothetical protein ACXV8O_16475 [Methylobacter sp.]
MDEALLKAIRESVNSRTALGNERFKDEVEAMLARSVRLGTPGRQRKIGFNDVTRQYDFNLMRNECNDVQEYRTENRAPFSIFSHDKQIRKYTMKAPFFLTSAAFYKLAQLIALLIFIMLNSSAAYARKEAPPKPIFKLIQGQGTEVCEAYLQRLNATEFLDNNPVKGRETEPVLKGFIDLKPIPLTAEEIQRIYYKTLSFERYQDQNLLEDFFKKGEESQRKRGFPVGGLSETMGIPPNTLDIINKSIVANQKTPFVRYQMQLDLDNDGIASDVIIKNNRGVFIVDHQLQQIDENRMKRIFADQEALAWPTMVQFPTLAFPITVFGYNNRYYFDGFLIIYILKEAIL